MDQDATLLRPCLICERKGKVQSARIIRGIFKCKKHFFSLVFRLFNILCLTQSSCQDTMLAVSANHRYVHIYVPCRHWYNTCHTMFTILVYCLTFITGGGLDGGGVTDKKPSHFQTTFQHYKCETTGNF